MNIICNNCVGARLYQQLHIQYNNPFMWSRFNRLEDFIFMIKNFNNINFNNIQLLDINNVYNLRIDDKFNVEYPHYKKNYDNSEQFIVDNEDEEIENRDFISPNIEDYIISKYNERLKRMNYDDITFLIIDYNYDNKLINELFNCKTEKIILFTDKPYTSTDNIKVCKNTLGNHFKTGEPAKILIKKYNLHK